MNEATVFGEAITPLARTFPSWTTILSGEYPRQNGIRFNLAQQNHIDTTHLLPEILKQHGYQTVFATDETRFSNMNTHYGFDEIISPPMGLNDFLLGTFNDFPLSNVITNTMVGKWLFPYSYANRPVYFLYDPDSFLQLLNPLLKKSRSQPLFLAVHFCLPHYPYLWASSPVKENNAVARYVASVGRADQQVQDFFVMLQKNHLLDHAIVVLLSDHGEGLEIPGDRITEKESFLVTKSKSIPKFYPPSLDKEAVDESAGHGTDVLGLSQYHTVLAFKLYGFGKQKHRMVPGIVSMLNIKPTVLHLLGLNKEKSLVPVIRGTQEKVAVPKHIFLESDFTPQSIRTVYPETRQVMLEGVQLFQIDPLSTFLTVKDSMGQMIIASKQYADIDGEWMLALYPQNKHFQMPILINLVSGKWTNDLHSFLAKQAPTQTMLSALKAFYGDEIRTN